MPQGRCAGCGKIDGSCKVILSHTVGCPDFVALYKTDPSKALPPDQEFLRWKNEEGSPAAKALAKDIRLQEKFRELDARRDQQVERWKKPKDPLDD